MKRFISKMLGHLIYGLMYIIFGTLFLAIDAGGIYYSILFFKAHMGTAFGFILFFVVLAIHGLIGVFALHEIKEDKRNTGTLYYLGILLLALPIYFAPHLSKAIGRNIPIVNNILPREDRKDKHETISEWFKALPKRIFGMAADLTVVLIAFAILILTFVTTFACDAAICFGIYLLVVDTSIKLYAIIAVALFHLLLAAIVCVRYNWAVSTLVLAPLSGEGLISIAMSSLAGVVLLPIIFISMSILGLTMLGVIAVFAVPLLIAPMPAKTFIIAATSKKQNHTDLTERNMLHENY